MEDLKSTYEEREIALRVDFDDLDDDGQVWASLRFMLGPRHPVEGDVVFLADSKGNSCFGTIGAVNGWIARITPDWASWSGPWPAPQRPSPLLHPASAGGRRAALP